MNSRYILLIALLLMLGPSALFAWDLYYTGDTLPNDISLADQAWETTSSGDYSHCTVQGGVLHVVDGRSDTDATFNREVWAIPSGSPVTIEARVRIASASQAYSVVLGASTRSFSTFVSLYPDRLVASFPDDSISYALDLTAFRTVRIATNAAGESFVWVDGLPAAQGITSVGNQAGVIFGSASVAGTGDSYWDYVAYSKAFLAVPEPSSFAVVAGFLAALGGSVLSRKRHHQPAA